MTSIFLDTPPSHTSISLTASCLTVDIKEVCPMAILINAVVVLTDLSNSSIPALDNFI